MAFFAFIPQGESPPPAERSFANYIVFTDKNLILFVAQSATLAGNILGPLGVVIVEDQQFHRL